MENRDSTLLEFPHIYAMLQELLLSQEGEAHLAKEPFFSSSQELEDFRAPIIAIDYRLRAGYSMPRSRFPAIEEAMHQVAREGATLEGESIYAIGLYLATAKALIGWFRTAPDELLEGSSGENLLFTLAKAIVVQEPLMQVIQNTLNEQGEIREDYPPLKALRKELARLYQRQQQTAQGYLQEEPNRFQTNQPTFRDNRVLLPVKSGYRSQISGVIQGVSASGSTLFMEPPGLMEMNNQVTEKQHELMRETQRVFQELSGSIRQHVVEIEHLRQWIGSVDTLMARAALGHRWSGVPITIAGQIGLKQCRHPLLGKGVVPVDITLPSNVKGLVLSGPNAGGKSVTMKTLGLFALMNQFGMLVPCAEGSKLPLFPKVFASIGDEQSITLALSTFSGQMGTLADICKHLVPGSLVILDEIGAGTDPLEGGALAQSLIEYLLDHRCFVVATSHHKRVKRFGSLRDDITSGAMEFDEEHHTPTYKLMVGHVGESHGIETAHQYGIPQAVIDRANNFLSQDDISIDQQLRAVERRKEDVRKAEDAIAKEQHALATQEQELAQQRHQLERREQLVRAAEARDVSLFLKESRKTFENLIREIREEELTKERIAKGRAQIAATQKQLAELRHKAECAPYDPEQGAVSPKHRHAKYPRHSRDSGRSDWQANATLTQATNATLAQVAKAQQVSLQPGMKVKVGTSGQAGTLVEQDKKGRWVVQLGSIRMAFAEAEFAPVAPASTSQALPKITWVTEQLPAPKGLLDIRGYRAEDAVTALRQQLDRALSHNTKSFTILHGTGEGVLQKVVAEFLSSCREVRKFEYAPIEEGGYGKTVVHL